MNKWLIFIVGVVIGWIATTAYINRTERRKEIRMEEYQSILKKLEVSQRSVEMLTDMSHDRISREVDERLRLLHKIRVLIDDLDNLSNREIKYRLMDLTEVDDEE